ncbi:MAG TPA: TIGR02757 family protein [Flavobacteriales bacterium]|nr:TIGR02757 family protein [Flavobacteriales bacterium]
MRKSQLPDIKELLEEKTAQYNNRSFIPDDPICVPHQFTKKQDIEIAGFFAAIIAWGNRKSIVKNASRLVEMMDNSPHEFIVSGSAQDIKRLSTFVHRTFNGQDMMEYARALRRMYAKHDSLEQFFVNDSAGLDRISVFRREFVKGMKTEHAMRHISNPETGSAAKRLNMYLRWMVRQDKAGVDFGIWKNILPATLRLPLDVHTGNTARKLGLLNRKQDDAKAVAEITNVLRNFDPKDPVKYDFALFGLGVFERLV